MSKPLPPLNDAILYALAKLVDDSQTDKREPSLADIVFCAAQVSLQAGDPKTAGLVVGKEKRVRAVLSWAIEHNFKAGQTLIDKLIDFIRSRGGFRESSANFVGSESIHNLQAAFGEEGFSLTADGELRPKVLDSLSGNDLTEALEAYVRRAQKGSEDAALLTGT